MRIIKTSSSFADELAREKSATASRNSEKALSPSDKRTAADRGSGISADWPTAGWVAGRRMTGCVGRCSSGTRSKAAGLVAAAGGRAVTSGTFGTTPTSSSPPGCLLGSCLLSSMTHDVLIAQPAAATRNGEVWLHGEGVSSRIREERESRSSTRLKLISKLRPDVYTSGRRVSSTKINCPKYYLFGALFGTGNQRRHSVSREGRFSNSRRYVALLNTYPTVVPGCKKAHRSVSSLVPREPPE